MSGKLAIYIVRHGMDNENYRGGWSDLGLIEEGMEQAKLLANYLSDKKEKYSINKIISSDLRRAVETAKEIESKLNIPVKYCSDWREINNGVLAGMDNKDALIKYPGLFFNTLEMSERYPNGESPSEFYNRIQSTFLELCNNISTGMEEDDVIILTHGGVINVLYYILNNIKWTNKSPKLSKTSTTGMHKIEHIEGKWEIVMSNSVEHLYYHREI